MDERMKAAFVAGLGIDEATTDWDALSYRSVEQWDSIAHMALVVAIEDEFDLMLETTDIIDMSSFRVALEIVKRLA
jgi:acyl carrier protein